MSQVLAQSNPVASPGHSAVPRILIVDDEQHMCDICGRTLRRGGYEVVATNNPDAAARMLRSEERFDLLLTDIKMPTMSGLDLAHIARERDPAIAIIIMTGYASMENLQKAVQRGVADFLSKPFELEHLRLAVDQALNKRAILQDNLRLRTTEQLLESSTALGSTLDLDALIRILLRVSLQQSGCRAGFVLLIQDSIASEMTIASDSTGLLLAAGRELARRAFASGQPVVGDGEAFGQLPDAELRSMLAVPLRTQGELNGALVLCDDHSIALRPGVQEGIALLANHAAAALHNAFLYGKLGEAYQRLQDLDRLKSEFVAIASHELRTPLSIILGYTMMVRDQSEGDAREYLQRVLDSAQRIKEIVDNMVSLRHLETGEARPAVELLTLQEVIDGAIDQMRAAATARRHTLQIDLPAAQLIFMCDREKLRLIVEHLLSNAIKFTPQGGRIIVRAALRPLGAVAPAGARAILRARHESASAMWVAIEVEDNGIGIPEREQTQIFDRFYQVAASLTRDQGGTGLGLALVRELVSALGGSIWVTSRSGAGSIFSVALPYHVTGRPDG